MADQLSVIFSAAAAHLKTLKDQEIADEMYKLELSLLNDSHV